MDYASYSFSATTQAEFYRAEAEVLHLGEKLARAPYAQHLKTALMAIDAIFAIRMTSDTVLPAVPLIAAYDLTDTKHCGDAANCIDAHWHELGFSKKDAETVVEALHYMQALDWVAGIAAPDFKVSLETVQVLHEILVNGKSAHMRYRSFRSSYLPHKKGVEPAMIPFNVNELCMFCNSDYFSPIGQASVIHHAFESIVPFDSMVDRTGLLFAFVPMFRRGLFANGYVPICWGCSLEKEFRRTLKDSSRDTPSSQTHLYYRERWAAYNARNTHMAVVIADSFITRAEHLRARWHSRGLRIPANSALDRLLDLLVAFPRLSTGHAAKIIGKSYGATNEAMGQLAKAGIVKEASINGRERIFVCRQATAMIESFVDELVEMSEKAKENGL